MNKEPEKQKHPSDKNPEANIPDEEQKNYDNLPASNDAENDADNGPDLSPKMSTQPKPVKPKKNPVENKEAEFWAECRRRAMLHNVPAWKIAEQLYNHQLLDG